MKRYPSLSGFLWLVLGFGILMLVLMGGGVAYVLWPPPPRPFQLVKSGMTRAEIEAAVGPPDWVENEGTPSELWAYRTEGGIHGWMWPMYVPFDGPNNVSTEPFY